MRWHWALQRNVVFTIFGIIFLSESHAFLREGIVLNSVILHGVLIHTKIRFGHLSPLGSDFFYILHKKVMKFYMGS